MRLLYLTALLLYLSCVSAQDTTPEISLNELPCEDILFVNRNGFDGIVGGSIIYIEAYGNYTKVYLPGGMLLTHASISFYAEKLAEPAFLRVHKSFLVAMDKIDRISGNRLFLGEYEVPIGQTYRQKVMGLIG